MGDSVGLLDLPNEVLLSIAAWLPLKDLKAFGETCHQLAAVSTTAMQKRRVSLRISRNLSTALQQTMQLLPETVLEGCHRSYRSITVDCLMYDTFQDLVDLMSRPPIAQWEVKQLLLDVFEPEAVAFFIQMCSSLMDSVTSMRVTVFQGRSEQYPERVVWLKMPNLRELIWIDANFTRFRFVPSYHRISLVAPRLSTLHQQVYRLEPCTLVIANNGDSSSAGYHTLDHLYAILTEEITKALEEVVLPKLSTFIGRISVQFSKHQRFWKSLTHRMPNLVKLELQLIENNMSMSFFCGLIQLRELVIRDGVMNFEPKCEYRLDALEKLCLESSEIVPAQGTLHLTNVHTLCLSGNVEKNGHNDLDVHLPSLKYLYVNGNENTGLNIVNCRNLQYLRMDIHTSKIMLPWVLSLDTLTFLHLDCRWSNCNSEYTQILSRAPNLTHCLLLVFGCNLDGIANLPTWCPKLRFLALHTDGQPTTFISYHTLLQIFSHPTIEEIVIGYLEVSTQSDKPIVIPHQLHTLVMKSVCVMMSQHTLFAIDDDHPQSWRFHLECEITDGLKFLSCNSQHYRSHLLHVHHAYNPFKCSHFLNFDDF